MTFDVITTMRGAAAIVTGRLDVRSATDLRLKSSEALVECGGVLTLNLSAVEFIDSSGLGALISLHREAEREGRQLQIVPPAGSAREIFALTRTERYFTLVETSEKVATAT